MTDVLGYHVGTIGMSEKRGTKETSHVEAISDGVIAMAITLLILEIKVPHLLSIAGSRELLQSLLAEWPSLLAFVLSFTAVLIMTRGMSVLGIAYDLHNGSSEGQAPGSSASWAWPMASRRRGSSFPQFTMTFWE